MTDIERNEPVTSHYPIHPGLMLKLEVLPARNVTVSALAKAIGHHRPFVSKVLNGRAPISPLMAARIEAAIGYPASLMLKMQLNHDLAVVRDEEGERLGLIPKIAA